MIWSGILWFQFIKWIMSWESLLTNHYCVVAQWVFGTAWAAIAYGPYGWHIVSMWDWFWPRQCHGQWCIVKTWETYAAVWYIVFLETCHVDGWHPNQPTGALWASHTRAHTIHEWCGKIWTSISIVYVQHRLNATLPHMGDLGFSRIF